MNKQLLTLATLAVLAGCNPPPAPPPVATEDLNGGIARTCTATPIDLSAPSPTSTIKMTNDGWCAARLKQANGEPFLLGLLKVRPQDGHVLIQKLGGETRIEYSPENRFVGTDKFTVALRPTAANAPDVTVQVTAEVTMGANMAPPPAAAPPPPAPARNTRTRR